MRPADQGSPYESCIATGGTEPGSKEEGREKQLDAFQGMMSSTLPVVVCWMNHRCFPASETLGWALQELEGLSVPAGVVSLGLVSRRAVASRGWEWGRDFQILLPSVISILI